MMRRVKSLFVVLLAWLLSACMIMTPLGSDPAQWRAQLKSGDSVQVTLRDGSKKAFKLDSVEADALNGGGQHIAFSDISQLAREQMDGTKTTLLVVGLVAVAAAASSGGGGGGDSGY